MHWFDDLSLIFLWDQLIRTLLINDSEQSVIVNKILNSQNPSRK